ncbi:MAG: type II toxin-antitoxin system HicB family antitoxin [Prolixibacteraceae bacterium]|nr:type II toxin-antitoxin system HicB family antitoxin [Prolixibacteraceae bacterium]
MKKVTVTIAKSDNNFMACVEGLEGFVCTAPTLEKLKQEVKEGVNFHIEGMKEDGDPIPEIFQNGYEFDYKWDVESLLYYYDGIITRSALEKLTGINQRQLGHYATGRSKPRPIQSKKIEKALHVLGDELISVSL